MAFGALQIKYQDLSCLKKPRKTGHARLCSLIRSLAPACPTHSSINGFLSVLQTPLPPLQRPTLFQIIMSISSETPSLTTLSKFFPSHPPPHHSLPSIMFISSIVFISITRYLFVCSFFCLCYHAAPVWKKWTCTNKQELRRINN